MVRSLVGILFVLALALPVRAQQPLTLVAAGDASPLGGLPFSGFPSVALDPDGRLVFLGDSTGTFRVDGAGVPRVIAAGDLLPDGSVAAGVSAPSLAPDGCAVVRAFRTGGGGMLVRRCGSAAAVQLLASGDVLPGGVTVADLAGTPAAAGNDVAATLVVLADGRQAVVRLTGPVAATLAVSGDPAPSGGTFSSFRLVGASAAGLVGFRAAVANGRDGFFVADGPADAAAGEATRRAVVQVGEASPVGGTFAGVTGAAMNDGGTWAFRATVEQGGSTAAGVFRIDGATPGAAAAVVALEGDPADQPGVTFRGFPSSLVPTINAGGTVAFRATLSGAAGGSGIFVIAPGGAPERVVGTRETTTDGSIVRLRDPAIADDGSVCFPASITGGGPALFVWRAGAQPVTLVRLGDRTDVDSGQERFRFSAPAVRATAEGAVFLGSRLGVFRRADDGTIAVLAFVGGPTPLGGIYADLDPPVPGRSLVVFGAEVSGGREARALVRVGTTSGRTGLVAAATQKAWKKERFVDFFAGALDGIQRADVGPRDEVAFETSLEGGPVRRGLFAWKAGGRPRLVDGSSRKGPGGTWEAFGTPAVLKGASMAFLGQIDGGGGRTTAAFVRRGSKLQRLIGQGDGLAADRFSGRVQSVGAPDAASTLVACQVVMQEAAREAIVVRDRQHTGLLLATGDPATDGAVFRGFERPIVSDVGVAVLARLQGSTDSPGLYRVPVTAAPAKDAPAPAVTLLAKPGTASPLGGVVDEITAVEGDRAGAVVVAADLVGASARTAVLLFPVP